MRVGCSDADITSIKEGFKEALGKPILAVLSFRDFAQTFAWFASTLHMMGQACHLLTLHHKLNLESWNVSLFAKGGRFSWICFYCNHRFAPSGKSKEMEIGVLVMRISVSCATGS